MTENQAVPPAASAVPPPPRKRPWVFALLLVAVFFCGIVCGGGATAFLIARGVANAIRHPELRPERQTKWLSARLKLNADQRDQVRKIFTEQDDDIAALWIEVRPRVAARIEKSEAEIEKILTPKQQTKLRDLIARLRERWFPNLPEPPPPKP